MLPSTYDGKERSARSPPGHARSAHPEHGRRRLAARLRDRAAPQGRVERRAADRRELALPGVAASAAQGLGESSVGRIGEQSPRALLHTDGIGPEAAHLGASRFRPVDRRDPQSAERHVGRAMADLIRRVRQWMRWRRMDDDLSEELAFHRMMAQRRFEADGMASDAAAAAAQRAFGSGALAADRARDVWLAAWAQDIARDVRFAVRLLARERSFTALIVTVLGLGIGTANLQSVLVDAVCIRGLPIPRVDRVLFLGARDAQNRDVALSYREFDRIGASTTGIGGVSAFASAPAVLGDDDRAPDRALATYVSAALFQILRERPQLGRDFAPADDRPGATPVAILTAGVWRSRTQAIRRCSGD